MDRLGFFKHGLSALFDAATSVVGMKKAVESMTEAVDEALSKIKTDMCLHLPSLEAKMYEDAENTLSELALMGYTQLEVGAYYGDTIHDQKVTHFRDMVRKVGLKVVAAHLNREYKPEVEEVVVEEEGSCQAENSTNSEIPEKITAEQRWWSEALDAVSSLGCKCVVMSKVPAFPPEQMEQMAQTYASYFARIAQMTQQRGMKFCYHPMAQELKAVEGRSFLDLVMQDDATQGLWLQLDTFEALSAGVDFQSLMERYNGRIASIHLHDRAIVGESGDIDFEQVVRSASKRGINDVIIEQRHFTLPPMNCIERSIQNVMSLPSIKH